MNRLQQYYTIIAVILTAGVLVIHFYSNSPILAIISGSLYLLFLSFLCGKNLRNGEDLLFTILLGLLFVFGGISFLATISYYLWQFNEAVFIAIVILLPIIISVWSLIKPPKKKSFSILQKFSVNSIILRLGHIILLIGSITVLLGSQTTEAIRSPWLVVNKNFFLIYFLACLALIGILLITKKGYGHLILHFAVTTAVALIVYPLGYGFDSFIHVAAENRIFETGVILPKTLYYIGQYTLVVYLAKLLVLPVILVDKFLVPALASLFIPAATWLALTRGLALKRSALVSAFIFLIPLSSFIVTTPQGLANILAVTTLLLAIVQIKEKSSIIPLLFLGLVTLFIHPLTGIAIAIFLALLFVNGLKINKAIKNGAFITTLIGSLFAFPAIFYLLSVLQGNTATALGQALTISIPKLSTTSHFKPLLDLVYLYALNKGFILAALAIVGIIILWRRYNHRFLIFPITFVVILVNVFLLAKTFSFPFLIDYERSAYIERLAEIAFFFLIPVIFVGVAMIIERFYSRGAILKIAFTVFAAGLLTTALYLTYPRVDAFSLSRGFNVSQTDINAVHFVDEQANNKYVVLSNQAVAAAAIQEFGFSRYLPAQDNPGSEHYFYPIPTSSPLYNLYLKMVYEKPVRPTMLKAMRLTGVREAYFVINDYWYQSDQIIQQAKQTADEWYSIDDDKIHVFFFDARGDSVKFQNTAE